jgi:pimeloyl-ACP methyl ester carboxylesterase
VVAPDQRGYGRSSAPRDVEAYRSDHLAADLLGLLDDQGADEGIFVGHDWGSIVVWDLARLRPDRVRGVVNVSVPYTPWPAPPTEVMRAMWGDRFFYILYFQQPEVPETDLGEDVHRTLHGMLWAGSAAMHGLPPAELPPMEGTRFLDSILARGPAPHGLPEWISEEEFLVYVDQFEASGFFGPISWYRNFDADYEITKDLPPPPMPCAFIGGSCDGVIARRPEYVEQMETELPDYRSTVMIEGAGHWTQQEKPHEFNAALFHLLDRLR